MKNVLLLTMTLNLVANAASTSIPAPSAIQVKAAIASLTTLIMPYYTEQLKTVLREHNIDGGGLSYNLIKARIQGIPLEKIARTRAAQEILDTQEIPAFEKNLVRFRLLTEEMKKMVKKGTCEGLFTPEEAKELRLADLNPNEMTAKAMSDDTLQTKLPRFYDEFQTIRLSKRSLVKEQNAHLDARKQALFAEFRNLIRASLIADKPQA